MYARVHKRLLGALAPQYVDGSCFSLLETHRLMDACWHAVRLSRTAGSSFCISLAAV